MARTAVQIEADIATLQAIPPGVRSVSYTDRTTVYSSEAEKRDALSALRAELAGVANTGGRVRQIRLSSSKGL